MNKLIMFTASWCSNCQVVKASLEDNNVSYTTVDVDTSEGEELAKQNGVRGLPTVLVVDDKGEEVRRIVGLQPAAEYVKYV